jgi:josephin
MTTADDKRNDTGGSAPPPQPLYHERQRLALCGVHAVNNLLQTERFTKHDFDRTCLNLVQLSSQQPQQLWKANPHRSVWGIGNYDVNVVTALLQEAGYCVRWQDRRTALRGADVRDLVGILWNVKSNRSWWWWLAPVVGGRHWIALLRNDRDDRWWNLDSALVSPRLVGTHQDTIQLLESMDDAHILLIQQRQQQNGR